MDDYLNKENESELIGIVKEADLLICLNELKLTFESLSKSVDNIDIYLLKFVTLQELITNHSRINNILLFGGSSNKGSSQQSLFEWVSLNSKVVMLSRYVFMIHQSSCVSKKL
jgi:hypothetical protein